MNLIDFQKEFPTEESCLRYLEEQRWSDGRYCPHCGSFETYKFKDGKLFKCSDCHKQFTVKVGTIFSDSHVPLQKWFYAIYLSTSLKKGISSIQLSKYIGITQKSAWFMLQRIRYGLQASGRDDLLGDTVEIDETYIGGKQKNGSLSDKAVVFGAVERQGRARLKHVKSSGARVLLPEISKTVKSGTTIYSDQLGSYKSLKRLGYIHDSVNHSLLEFGRGEVHTNTIEGAWNHFKLGLKAIYLGVSVKHLQLYCNEFEYRYNTRQLNDYERFNNWFNCINGKRLTYKKLIG